MFFAGISFAQQTEFTGFTTDKFKFHSIHLQGIDCDETGIYFGFGNGVTKTDWKGKVIAESASAYEKGGHIGDVCVHKGKLYATSWIQPKGKGVNGREGLIQVFDAATLKPLFDENKKNLIINQISDLNKEISKNRLIYLKKYVTIVK